MVGSDVCVDDSAAEIGVTAGRPEGLSTYPPTRTASSRPGLSIYPQAQCPSSFDPYIRVGALAAVTGSPALLSVDSPGEPPETVDSVVFARPPGVRGMLSALRAA
jgi:hypothetical protein